MLTEKKLRIAFVCQPWDRMVPPVGSGSIIIWTYEVMRHLKDICDFVVYTKKKTSSEKNEMYDGVFYRRIPVHMDRVVHKLAGCFCRGSRLGRPLFSRGIYHLPYILRIARALAKQKVDIVHIFNFSQFIPVIRAFNPEIKIVLNMRCEWLTQIDQAMIEPRLRETDLILGCSDFITNKIRRAFPQYSSRCKTVLNGVDVNRFTGDGKTVENKGYKKLLFVGRISPEKGLHVLVEAFKRVIPRYPHVRLEIIGAEGSAPKEFIVGLSEEDKVKGLAKFYTGDYLAALKANIPPALADRVFFYGCLPNPELVNYYRKADILINPSFSESFGRSLIEAMACGVPVIASRVGGIPEIVEEGTTGLLVESGNVTMLTQAILRLLTDQELRDRMGRMARSRTVEHYSWPLITENLLKYYREIHGQNSH